MVIETMGETQIRTLVRQMDTADAAVLQTVWEQLRPLGETVVPYFLELYPQTKKMQGRRDMVYHTIRFARTSEAAFQLGIAALNDRSGVVRYRACSVLAYSLRRDAVPLLDPLLTHKDQKTVADAQAALDAIRHQNHHYFIDREHSGRTYWEVNKGDMPLLSAGGIISRLAGWMGER